MSTVTININGMDYNLKGRESEDYLAEIAKYVDEKVRDIMANNRKLSSTAGATLVALNIADELFKADEEVEKLIKKNTSLEERNTTLKERLKEIREENENTDDLKKIIEELRNENITLREELEGYYKEAETTRESNNILKENENSYKDKFMKLNEECRVMEEDFKKINSEKDSLKVINKDTKFQLQNLKYKVLDLEKKLIDAQVNLAIEKKKTNSLLK